MKPLTAARLPTAIFPSWLCAEDAFSHRGIVRKTHFYSDCCYRLLSNKHLDQLGRAMAAPQNSNNHSNHNHDNYAALQVLFSNKRMLDGLKKVYKLKKVLKGNFIADMDGSQVRRCLRSNWQACVGELVSSAVLCIL